MASSLAARGPCQRLVAVGVVGDDRALVYYELAASFRLGRARAVVCH